MGSRADNERERRLLADFNGLFGDVLCLSHSDHAKDEFGNSVELFEGMKVLAYAEDSLPDDSPAFLVARGTVEVSPMELRCNGSRGCLRMDERSVRHVESLDDA